MDNFELASIIKRIPKIKKFHGVFSIDTIPEIRSGCMIVNLDPASSRGSHWVGLFVNGSASYFDTFSRKAPIEVSSKFKVTEKLRKPVQPLFSTLCGFYCILFLYLKSSNYKMDAIESLMHKLTDVEIKKLVQSLL
jgi:hypothetical protein